MQFIQNACLTNLIVSSILTGSNYKPISFSWDLINQHRFRFNKDYNYNDARILLQLSLMVTDSNFTDAQLDIPSWLQDNVLAYNVCPLFTSSGKVSNPLSSITSNYHSSPRSKMDSERIGHILYDKDDNVLVIVFTGTSNACLAGLDLEYGQTELDSITNYIEGIRGHQGIFSAYKSIRPQLTKVIRDYLPKNPQIVITGHSLGGALSHLCALDLAFYNPIQYSFASPLIFNPLGSLVYDKYVKYSYRIANLVDLVTLSPLPIMPNKDLFCHVGKLVHFQRHLGEYPKNHSLAYAQEYSLTDII